MLPQQIGSPGPSLLRGFPVPSLLSQSIPFHFPPLVVLEALPEYQVRNAVLRDLVVAPRVVKVVWVLADRAKCK